MFSLRFKPRAALFAFLAMPLAAQVAPSAIQINGTVLNPERGPVPAARVSLTQEGASATTIFSGVTDAHGDFSATLNVGRYKIMIQASDFLELSETLDLTAAPGAGAMHEFHLQSIPTFASTVVRGDSGYFTPSTTTATKTLTPLRDVPQSITVISKELIQDQMMRSVEDVVRYVPGIQSHQGENNRDQVIIRGNSSSADFFVNGVRDDVQYYRDLYNLQRVEAIKGPNAMVFGRGGGGGLINRVTKEASSIPLREITLQGGSFGNKRAAGDLSQPFGSKLSLRMNGMYENSDSFRQYVGLKRYGFSPTVTILPSPSTRITVSYENFHDHRVSDRGITSFQGRPADVPIQTFYGNPNDAYVRALVNSGAVALAQRLGRVTLRNRTQFAEYDRGYQNYVPGATNAARTTVALTAYNNATDRLNVFNQTDLNADLYTGRVKHTLLGGIELGRQTTNNFRNTGYFNNTATSTSVDFLNPITSIPVTFRQSATDADNHLLNRLGAAFVQDQIVLSRYVQVVAGLRVDQFDLRYHNNRNNDNLRRIDNLLSPRAGIVIKPKDSVSIYGNYAVSYLPSSGDQFSSLTSITQQMKPEKFTNYELGAKWDWNGSLSLTTALYRLDRTNTRSTDPNDPTRIIQTGSTRSRGYEVGVNGNVMRKWQIAGGYAYQDAYISSATTASLSGFQVGQVPHHTFSLWNNYKLTSRLGGGLGISKRANMFATADNTVTLPGYSRADAAMFFSISERTRLQVNAENIFNKKYISNADSNTNISPGSSRGVRVGLTARF